MWQGVGSLAGTSAFQQSSEPHRPLLNAISRDKKHAAFNGWDFIIFASADDGCLLVCGPKN